MPSTAVVRLKALGRLVIAVGVKREKDPHTETCDCTECETRRSIVDAELKKLEYETKWAEAEGRLR